MRGGEKKGAQRAMAKELQLRMRNEVSIILQSERKHDKSSVKPPTVDPPKYIKRLWSEVQQKNDEVPRTMVTLQLLNA